jgi:Zn-finger domain-containing protein
MATKKGNSVMDRENAADSSTPTVFYRRLNVGTGNLLSRSRSPRCSHRFALARLSVVFSYVPQSDSHACG